MINVVKTKIEGRLGTIAFVIGLLVLLFLFYTLTNHLIKNYPMERAIERWISNDHKFYSVKLIKEKKAVSFVGYDCKSINRITRGITRCSGEYYIFIDKINDKWVVNESSKVIIW